MKRIVIIGGGITGLAAAHRLVECNRGSGKQLDLTMLEAGNRLGGIIHTRERDGFLLESGPDSFISEKPAALELAKRLGLESQLIQTNDQHRRSFIVRGRRLLPVPEGFHLLAPSRFWPFVKSDLFSWPGKARMALDLLLPRRDVNGERDADDESLAQFVRRRLGREALDRVAQPMVGGIYTADPERLSLRATMPHFLEMERDQRSLIRALRKQNKSATLAGDSMSETSGARYSLFLSFERGMQTLVDQLSNKLSEVRIDLKTRVESLELDKSLNEWQVRLGDGRVIDADAVCIAVPASVAANLLRESNAELAAELAAIPYASSATINLAYKRDDIPHPLNGFGFVVPFIEKRSLIACTFSSVKFAGRAPKGHVLLRAFVGGALQPEMFELSEEDLLSRLYSDLRDLLGIERAPLFAEVSKWERAMPQYHVGHLERVARIGARVASLPGLVLAGNAYSGPGVPDCIRSGETAAELIEAR
jgi:oxygen-dependent protoporphyrinogen oxidase